MSDLNEVKALLDEINQAISGYDPVLKERARDILLEHAFRRAGARSGAVDADRPPGPGTARARGAGAARARRARRRAAAAP